MAAHLVITKERTFKRLEVLQEMLLLRLQGWSLDELAFRYGCEKTSVRKACLRNGLPAEIPLQPRPIIVFRLIKIDWTGERVNQGKNYQELLQEQRERQQRKRLQGSKL